MLCVLLLRGPQTTGELRGRTERLYTFDDLEAVEGTLHRLAEIGFAKQLPRQPGTKEPRWAHLMCGDVETVEASSRVSGFAGARGWGSRPHRAAGGRPVGAAPRVRGLSPAL